MEYVDEGDENKDKRPRYCNDGDDCAENDTQAAVQRVQIAGQSDVESVLVCAEAVNDAALRRGIKE